MTNFQTAKPTPPPTAATATVPPAAMPMIAPVDRPPSVVVSSVLLVGVGVGVGAVVVVVAAGVGVGGFAAVDVIVAGVVILVVVVAVLVVAVLVVFVLVVVFEGGAVVVFIGVSADAELVIPVAALGVSLQLVDDGGFAVEPVGN